MIIHLGLFLVLLFPTSLLAAGNAPALLHMDVNLHDETALQRGARTFRNYCLSCHSAAYMRYNRMGKDLRIPKQVLKDNFIFDPDVKPDDAMTVALSKQDGVRYFDIAPPDLSLVARARGADWLYTYLKTFYIDPERPFCVNNLVFEGVNMPHVLWELQGLQRPVYQQVTAENGSQKETITQLELAHPGLQSAAEYDRTIRDLVNFMVYLGEPVQLKREKIGRWVLLYLFIFLVVSYLLKREYWHDIHR